MSDNKYTFPEKIGFTSIPVLEFLKGLPWNAVTKNMLAAVRPNFVRESWGEVKCDACCWRVTVWLRGTKAKPTIDRITQEVSVGLAGGVAHGHALGMRLAKMGMRFK